jgi:hypothetical protein
MGKNDFIYSDKDNYKIHVVSLVPDKPNRLLLIPPLVGATGSWAVRIFRYFYREGCALMSFYFCGHTEVIKNKFTFQGTYRDTRAALDAAFAFSTEKGIPIHLVGACYGLIPLMHIMDELRWPRQVKSLFSVGGLLSINDILNFEDYNQFLKKRGIIFESKAEFISYMSTDKREFGKSKEKYVDALTEYLLFIFAELSEIISKESFGALQYSKAEFYDTFLEFLSSEERRIKIPSRFPCLFFSGEKDTILGFGEGGQRNDYSTKLCQIAPHAKLRKIRIDHFGRGEDHYVIGQEGMKFLVDSERG